jgi:hypothetical protein
LRSCPIRRSRSRSLQPDPSQVDLYLLHNHSFCAKPKRLKIMDSAQNERVQMKYFFICVCDFRPQMKKRRSPPSLTARSISVMLSLPT